MTRNTNFTSTNILLSRERRSRYCDVRAFVIYRNVKRYVSTRKKHRVLFTHLQQNSIVTTKETRVYAEGRSYRYLETLDRAASTQLCNFSSIGRTSSGRSNYLDNRLSPYEVAHTRTYTRTHARTHRTHISSFTHVTLSKTLFFAFDRPTPSARVSRNGEEEPL